MGDPYPPGRRAHRSLLFPPMSWPFVAVLGAILGVLLVLLEVGAFSYAYQRLGLDRSAVYLVLLATFLGSALNLPIGTVRSARLVSAERVVRFMGLRYAVPPVWAPQRTVIAVNVGGALVPAGVSAYLVAHDALGGLAVVGIGVVAGVVYLVARPVPGVGVVVPGLLPPLVAAAVGLLLGGATAPALAYVSGVLGTLLGADVLNLGRIGRLGAPVASIGGAGTFDGVLLSGIVAVLIASL